MEKAASFPQPEWERDWIQTEETHLERPRKVPSEEEIRLEHLPVLVQSYLYMVNLISRPNMPEDILSKLKASQLTILGQMDMDSKAQLATFINWRDSQRKAK